MFENFDLVIVGAGPTGCVAAERAASQLGWKVLLLDKRGHIAGNCFDRPHENGVLIHQYGPHYFRTNRLDLIEYLSQFTKWIPGNYHVKSMVGDKLFQFPVNLETLEQFFGRKFTEEEARAFIETLRQKNDQPKNSEEQVLSKVGKELFEAFYLGYTQKQWGKHPRELDPSVCGRIPVRFDRNPSYVNEKYQVMPEEGYTQMFRNMIGHPGITLLLNWDFMRIRPFVRPRKALVYTGPVDEYFDKCYGALAWRSLDFEFKEYKQEYVQPCVQISYPNQFPYTRSVEIKHVTGQKHPCTVVSYEYPKAEGDPYYPIPAVENRERYKKYEELARRETLEKNVFFCGRLATYRYMNTDEALLSAIELSNEIRKRFS